MANNWDDEFSSFDVDLSKPPIPATDMPVAGDSPSSATSVVPPSTDPVTPIQFSEPAEEDEDDMDASIKEAEEKLRQIEEHRKEKKKPNPYKSDEPKPQDPLNSIMELIEIANQLQQQANDTKDLMTQIEQVVENSEIHIKGVKSTLRRMDDYMQVMLAAKVIVEVLSKTARSEVFDTLEASHFLSVFKKTKRGRERKNPKMKTIIGDFQTVLGEGDKEEATAVARLLKQEAMSMQDDARDLAAALYETTSNYPDSDGQLALFSMIADQSDADSVEHIDHTMRLTEQVVVPVGEAKVMLQARANGDQQTIENILDRVITNLVENEKQ